MDIDPFVSLFFLTLWQNNTCSRLQLSIHSSIFFQLQDSEAFINPPVSSGSPPSWTLQRKFLLAACNYNFVDCFGLPGCLGASLQPYLCYFVPYPALGCIVRVHVTRWILIALPLEDRKHCSSVIPILAKEKTLPNLIWGTFKLKSKPNRRRQSQAHCFVSSLRPNLKLCTNQIRKLSSSHCASNTGWRKTAAMRLTLSFCLTGCITGCLVKEMCASNLKSNHNCTDSFEKKKKGSQHWSYFRSSSLFFFFFLPEENTFLSPDPLPPTLCTVVSDTLIGGVWPLIKSDRYDLTNRKPRGLSGLSEGLNGQLKSSYYCRDPRL